MEESQDNNGYDIQPYMFEPNPDDSVKSGDSDSDSTSTDDSLDEEFEAINSWRLTSKCGQCQLMSKTIESFCCHEKAVEYDEYDEKSAQGQGLSCISLLPSFVQNMPSQDVVEVDVAQYT